MSDSDKARGETNKPRRIARRSAAATFCERYDFESERNLVSSKVASFNIIPLSLLKAQRTFACVSPPPMDANSGKVCLWENRKRGKKRSRNCQILSQVTRSSGAATDDNPQSSFYSLDFFTVCRCESTHSRSFRWRLMVML